MTWTVIFTVKAERDLAKIPDDIAKKLFSKSKQSQKMTHMTSLIE